MTKNEAIELHSKCEGTMIDYLKTPCTVGVTLANKIKVMFNENYIVLNKDYTDAEAVNYNGYYQDLFSDINIICKCVRDNKELFDKLIWANKHKRELIN